MKKIIIIAVAAVACVAFTAGALSGKDTDSYVPEGYIEYSIPGLLTGTMSYDTFDTIYGLLPNDVKELMAGSYMDIAYNTGASFSYSGVLVKHTGNDWEFIYDGCSLKVIGVNPDRLDTLFRTASTM